MAQSQPSQQAIPVIRKPHERKRGSRKLMILLLLFFFTVLAILFFQSSISKISMIVITGNELVSTEKIGQAAGIAVGDRFFADNSTRIRNRIEQLKSIQTAKVTKRFPGLVRIQITEYSRVAFRIGEDGSRQAVLADGSEIPLDPLSQLVLDKPLLSGWQSDDPMKAKLCETLGRISDDLLTDISEIRPDPSDSYPDKIKMYTRSKFEVYTTISYLPDKIKVLGMFIRNLQDRNIKDGIINMLETDNHTPFPK
jgi:cell division protein FtsQ